MSMPERVKIGPVLYRVEMEPKLMGSNGDGSSSWLNGRIRYEQAQIEVCAEVAEQTQPAVLVHEILHGILEQAGMEEHPEQAIIALGYGLVQVLRENPGLVQYLQEGV